MDIRDIPQNAEQGLKQFTDFALELHQQQQLFRPLQQVNACNASASGHPRDPMDDDLVPECPPASPDGEDGDHG